MSRPRNEDKRLLSSDEYTLVSRTRQPTIKTLTNAELETLATTLREKRDRTQRQTAVLRREMRLKVQNTRLDPATDNTYNGQSLYLLAASIKRLNNERRRRKSGVKSRLVVLAQSALEKKNALAAPHRDYPESRTAGTGMQPIESKGLLPVERQGERPVLERSRKVR
jgi:hypothetical protein